MKLDVMLKKFLNIFSMKLISPQTQTYTNEIEVISIIYRKISKNHGFVQEGEWNPQLLPIMKMVEQMLLKFLGAGLL